MIRIGLCCCLLACLLGAVTAPVFALQTGVDSADASATFSGFGLAADSTTFGNSDSVRQVRGMIAWQVSDGQMLRIESGYGHYAGSGIADDGLTRTRIDYRQRLPMTDEPQSGFAGMAFQAALEFAGELRGTDGQSLLSGGATPLIRINHSAEFYPTVNLVNSFDKNFQHYNGSGFDLALRLDSTPDFLWPDALLRLEPGIAKYVVGQLAYKDTSRLRAAVGGSLFAACQWRLTAAKYYGRDLTTWRGSAGSTLRRDWSADLQLVISF